MDCNKAKRDADELGSLSNTLLNQKNNLEHLLNRMKVEWCGDASEEFQRQLGKLIKDLDLLRANLYEVAYNILQMVHTAQTGTILV